jgi:hypothetical protein
VHRRRIQTVSVMRAASAAPYSKNRPKSNQKQSHLGLCDSIRASIPSSLKNKAPVRASALL